jgi:hypothetical protein
MEGQERPGKARHASASHLPDSGPKPSAPRRESGCVQDLLDFCTDLDNVGCEREARAGCGHWIQLQDPGLSPRVCSKARMGVSGLQELGLTQFLFGLVA